MIRKFRNFLFGTLPSPSDATKFYNGAGEFSTPAAPPAEGAVASTFLISGGQVAWDSDYIFRVSAATYMINGVQYSSAEDTITLTAADPTNDRIDVIALDTNGAVVKIDGTAASTPSEPSVDPALYLKLAIVLVVAATTEPPTINIETVYVDAAGPPSEWTWTSSGASIVVNSTNNPHTGTHDIEGTNVVNAVFAKGVTAAPINPNDYNNLQFFIRSKAAWNNSRGLLITLRSAGVLVGAAVQLRRTGTYGFDSTQTATYQQVSIPISAFAVTSGTEIDELRFEDFGGAIGFYIDNISFQVNGTGSSNNNGLTQAQTDALYAPLVHATRHSSGGADPVSVLNLAGFPGGSTTFLRADGSFAAPVPTNTNIASLGLLIDGNGSVITTGLKGFLQVPFACTINEWTILSNDSAVLSGAIVIDVWKDTYANFPPTVLDTITASAKPTVTASAQKNSSGTLTGWTTSIAAGDVLGFNVDSVATFTRVMFQLKVTKT